MFKNEEIDIQLLEQQMDQNIFDIFQDYLPRDWYEVVFFAGYYKDDSCYLKYWVRGENGPFINCFNLIPEPQEGEEDIIQEQLMELHREIKFVRTNLNDKQKWVCMEMTLTSQGHMSKKYDYADGVAEADLKQYVENYKSKLNEKYD